MIDLVSAAELLKLRVSVIAFLFGFKVSSYFSVDFFSIKERDDFFMKFFFITELFYFPFVSCNEDCSVTCFFRSTS